MQCEIIWKFSKCSLVHLELVKIKLDLKGIFTSFGASFFVQLCIIHLLFLLDLFFFFSKCGQIHSMEAIFFTPFFY